MSTCELSLTMSGNVLRETTGRWPTVIAAGALAKPELERRDIALVGWPRAPARLPTTFAALLCLLISSAILRALPNYLPTQGR